jgi:hypothetical protein
LLLGTKKNEEHLLETVRSGLEEMSNKDETVIKKTLTNKFDQAHYVKEITRIW